MSLVQLRCTVDKNSVDDVPFTWYVYIIRKIRRKSHDCDCDDDDNDEFWFRCSDVLQYLSYSTSPNVVMHRVSPYWQRTWADLQNKPQITNPRCATVVPPNWDPDQVFVSAPGLERLLSRSRKVKAPPLRLWITSELMPMLKRTRECSIENVPARYAYQMMFLERLVVVDAELSKTDICEAMVRQHVADVIECRNAYTMQWKFRYISRMAAGSINYTA